MPRSRREIAAGRFKAECLALLDRVERTREVIVVTKRGRPVAKVAPIDAPSKKALRGSLVFSGDIVSPLDDAWDVER
jgi:prevent-host-death family protein